MENGLLGRVYQDGELIIKQGEVGDCMFIVLEGQVEVLVEGEDGRVKLSTRGEGEIIGEMAIIEREVRSATVRARGPVRLLTLDTKNFLRRMHEDPSLVYRLLRTMSQRIHELSNEVAQLKTTDASGEPKN